jgi:hypothetical protein
MQNRRSLEVRESLPSCQRDAALPGDDHMTRALRNISASVERRLLNVSRQSGEDFQYVLMRYGLERLMYRCKRRGRSDLVEPLSLRKGSCQGCHVASRIDRRTISAH